MNSNKKYKENFQKKKSQKSSNLKGFVFYLNEIFIILFVDTTSLLLTI